MKVHESILQRIEMTHKWLIESASDLSESQFSKRVSYKAPPIGWHLWHISRFADRLGASFKSTNDMAEKEIWAIENMAEQWGLDPKDLGILESGMEMALEVAATIPVVAGKKRILDYAERVFEQIGLSIQGLSMDQLNQPRNSVRAYARVEGKLVPAKPAQTTTGADLVFHLNHASRHLGSIEALRGVLIVDENVM
jgi:hypothetical protein